MTGSGADHCMGEARPPSPCSSSESASVSQATKHEASSRAMTGGPRIVSSLFRSSSGELGKRGRL